MAGEKSIALMVGNGLLMFFALLVLIDPINNIFHLKDLAFAAVVGYSLVFVRPSLRYWPIVGLPFLSILLGYLSGELQGNVIDDEALGGAIKGFVMILLVLWAPRYDFVKIMKWPSILVALLMMVLYIVVSSDKMVESAVWMFNAAYDHPIIMSKRSFLGIPIFGMYIKSLTCLMMVAAIYYQQLFHERKHRWWSLIVSVLFTFSFAVSGTRMTMMLPMVLIGVMCYFRIQQTRYARYMLYPFVALAALGFLVLVGALASEKGEVSNVIKYAHLTSYAELFTDHPLYLLIGQGPGTMFYSAGFKRMTLVTEWTYLELLRNYGLACLPILLMMLYPLRDLWRNRRDNQTMGVLIAYVCYLFICGTNPLLVSSTGMLIIICAYSYIGHLPREEAATDELELKKQKEEEQQL